MPPKEADGNENKLDDDNMMEVPTKLIQALVYKKNQGEWYTK